MRIDIDCREFEARHGFWSDNLKLYMDGRIFEVWRNPDRLWERELYKELRFGEKMFVLDRRRCFGEEEEKNGSEYYNFLVGSELARNLGRELERDVLLNPAE